MKSGGAGRAKRSRFGWRAPAATEPAE
jgi:hypothetical protein